MRSHKSCLNQFIFADTLESTTYLVVYNDYVTIEV